MSGTTFKSTLPAAGTHTSTYGLIQTHVTVHPTPVRTRMIEIPHRNGSLDVTDFLGSVDYGDREIEWEFTVKPRMNYASVRRSLETGLHGKKLYIVLDEEPGYAYYGRVILTDYNRDRTLYTIRLRAICEPGRIAL